MSFDFSCPFDEWWSCPDIQWLRPGLYSSHRHKSILEPLIHLWATRSSLLLCHDEHLGNILYKLLVQICDDLSSPETISHNLGAKSLESSNWGRLDNKPIVTWNLWDQIWQQELCLTELYNFPVSSNVFSSTPCGHLLAGSLYTNDGLDVNTEYSALPVHVSQMTHCTVAPSWKSVQSTSIAGMLPSLCWQSSSVSALQLVCDPMRALHQGTWSRVNVGSTAAIKNRTWWAAFS